MSLFNARLRLPGQSRIPLGVEVDVSAERITLTSGGRRVGGWRLDELEVALWTDGFHIRVDGEDLVLNVANSKLFAVEIGLTERRSPTPSATPEVNGSPDNGRSTATRAALATARTGSNIDELRRRISEMAQTLRSSTVSPVEAFGRWLELLEEINARLGQGSMSREMFCQLNTELLGMMPRPQGAKGSKAAS